MDEKIIEYLRGKIEFLYSVGMIHNETTPEECLDAALKVYKEQEEKNEITDSLIDYNDEIEDIEFLGDMETIDISVTGDSLFYCNGILTKNSLGIAMAADFIYSLSADEEMVKRNKILVKQLKNRYSDKNKNTKFWLMFDRTRMNFADHDNPEEDLIKDTSSSDDDASDGIHDDYKPFTPKPRKDFSKFKF